MPSKKPKKPEAGYTRRQGLLEEHLGVGKNICEWFDCGKPVVGNYRGTLLCREHIDDGDVHIEIDAEFEE